MRSALLTSTLILVALTVLTGVLYPLTVTLGARVAFPARAAGGFLQRDGRTVGSLWIGQTFEDPRYFWGRPSATTPPDHGAASSGSNLGPTNPALADSVRARITRLRRADPTNDAPVPVDLVTSSGSGLDPHISPAAADYQTPRVARARGLAEIRVRELIRRQVERRQWGLFGEPRVNVLRLNLALDALPPDR